MTIEVSPETESLIREVLGDGHFDSADELISKSIRAWRGRLPAKEDASVPRRSLVDVLMDPRFAGSDLVIERQKDLPRPGDDPMPGRHLVEVLMSAPLGGEDLIIERIKDLPRPIDL